MRLVSASIAGFRAFSSPVTVDLDAGAVLLIGPNGAGKTSFFDAILWALTGQVGRLGEGDVVVSRFSTTGEARVDLELSNANGDHFRVVRRRGEETILTLETENGMLHGPEAEAYLIRELWPDASTSNDPWRSVSRSLTRGVYLEQDLLRDFVEARTEQDRFQAVSELIGIGRLGEFQRELESARNRWQRTTTTIERDLQPLRERLAQLQARVDRLAVDDPADRDLEQTWDDWWAAASRLAGLSPVAVHQPGAAQRMDQALKELEVVQLKSDRRRSALRQVTDHLAQSPSVPEQPERLRQAALAAEEAVRAANKRVRELQEQVSEVRRIQSIERNQLEDLRLLAEVALRHLGDRCPVCDQEYDLRNTQARLESVLASGSTDPRYSETIEHPLASELGSALESLAALELEATSTAEALRSVERNAVAYESWRSSFERLLQVAELDPDTEEIATQVVRLEGEAREVDAELEQIRTLGEQLSLRLGRIGEAARRDEFERELGALRSTVATQEAELDRRVRTRESSTTLIEALRTAGDDLVAEELLRLQPLLQAIYATIDPHPAFRTAEFLSRTIGGRGRLWIPVSDGTAGVDVQEPREVLSSSQLGVLALSVFLALNLGVARLPLDLVALDDPLQSLDDINLLGVVDLVRRMRPRRQLLISTHDVRFGELLARKLRPLRPGERSIVVTLDSWTRDGPTVELREIPADPNPLRIVA